MPRFIPLGTAGKKHAFCVPVRDLTAWIEQNILLSLDSVAVRQKRRDACAGSGKLRELPEAHRL